MHECGDCCKDALTSMRRRDYFILLHSLASKFPSPARLPGAQTVCNLSHSGKEKGELEMLGSSRIHATIDVRFVSLVAQITMALHP